MADFDKRINAYYDSRENDYFMLESGNVLEVSGDDFAWEHFKTYSDFMGIADDFDDLLNQISDEVYKEISDRAVDHYIKENEGKFVVENAGIPGAGNVWNLYDKETGDCLFNDNVYTTEEDSYRDVIASYFAQEVAQTALSREVWGTSQYYDGLEGLLKYCDDKGVDVSDLLEYREVDSSIDRNSSAIAFATKEMAEITGGDISRLADGAENMLQSYLDNEVYYVREFDKKGNEIDSCGGFIGDDVTENGIEDNFGRITDKIGEFRDIDECFKEVFAKQLEEFAIDNDLKCRDCCGDRELVFESDAGVEVGIFVDLDQVKDFDDLREVLFEQSFLDVDDYIKNDMGISGGPDIESIINSYDRDDEAWAATFGDDCDYDRAVELRDDAYEVRSKLDELSYKAEEKHQSIKAQERREREEKEKEEQEKKKKRGLGAR